MMRRYRDRRLEQCVRLAAKWVARIKPGAMRAWIELILFLHAGTVVFRQRTFLLEILNELLDESDVSFELRRIRHGDSFRCRIIVAKGVCFRHSFMETDR